MLPPTRDPGSATYSLALVCLGNICRSPMAHVVLEAKLAAGGLGAGVSVASFGTGDWHLGEPMDRRAAATLAAAGYDPTRHRARHVGDGLSLGHDLVLVMDHSNLRDVRRSTSDIDLDRVLMFRSFDPMAGGELAVPDPWYGGQAGFDEVLAIVERTTDALVEALAAR
ncbi:MAG: low molecular weight protein-tyrosine-phosphatase [Nocardioidaceae bacterium]